MQNHMVQIRLQQNTNSKNHRRELDGHLWRHRVYSLYVLSCKNLSGKKTNYTRPEMSSPAGSEVRHLAIPSQ